MLTIPASLLSMRLGPDCLKAWLKLHPLAIPPIPPSCETSWQQGQLFCFSSGRAQSGLARITYSFVHSYSETCQGKNESNERPLCFTIYLFVLVCHLRSDCFVRSSPKQCLKSRSRATRYRGKISDLLRKTFFSIFFYYFHIERKTEITIISLLNLPSQRKSLSV